MRWWMWLGLAALLLVCAVAAVRIGGMRRLDAALATVAAAGLPVDTIGYIALAPPVDADRQRRIGRYMLWNAPRWGDEWPTMPFSSLAELRLSKHDRERLERKLAAGRTACAEVGAILDEGPVVLSLYGFCERDPARLRRMDLATVAAMPLPSLLHTRDYVNWWAQQACLAEDPESHLHRLDQLLQGMDHPGSLIDAMIAIACTALRDDAHLWLATRGRLPEVRLQRWLAEVPAHRRWCADGLASERTLFWGPIARLPPLPDPAVDFTWRIALEWPTIGYQCAYAAEHLANQELRLRGRPGIGAVPPPFGFAGTMSAIMLPNLDESAITAIQGENRHRRMRLAGVIAMHHRSTGSLPTAEDLPAALRAGIDAELPPQRYLPIAPHRFRLDLDPAGPLPASVPPARVAGGPAASGPTAKAPAANSQAWSLEIDLDAILVPPPEKTARKP